MLLNYNHNLILFLDFSSTLKKKYFFFGIFVQVVKNLPEKNQFCPSKFFFDPSEFFDISIKKSLGSKIYIDKKNHSGQKFISIKKITRVKNLYR